MKQERLSAKSLKQNTELDSSYSGDKPNSFLRQFAEAHLQENPYDPMTDSYEVSAFDKPIETTKATAIYNMHTYWSKKPHDAIMQYIEHYTKPKDIVLDPMCGSGGTALAALIEGRKAIAIDASPAATFITKNYCTPIDVAALEVAFEDFMEKVKPELDWLYETRCDRCGGKAITLHTVYSQRFQCPRCLEIIPLFDCPEAQVPAKTQHKDKPDEMKIVQVCPHCKVRWHMEEISTHSKSFGAVPVLIKYECLVGCKPKRSERRYNDANINKREFFEKYDLKKIAEIEAKPIPYWYPPNRMMNIESDTAPWGDEWRPGRNFRTVAELFTKRNLWGLGKVLDSMGKNDRTDLRVIFTWALLKCSRMMRFCGDGIGRLLSSTYYIPQIGLESNVLLYLKEAYNDIHAHHEAKWSLLSNKNLKFVISTQDSRNLSSIPSNSIDYIFTDPSYSNKVQYGELNFIWESWLNFDTKWHDNEIIVNETRGRSVTDWSKMLSEVMSECYRVLKPGRWLSLCYHDTSEGTWALVQDVLAEAGFIVDTNDQAIFIGTTQKTINQILADKVTKRDLVINFRKPRANELPSLKISGEEDPTNFNQKVSLIIHDFLLANPGSTKDRVYDFVVSHMVRRGQMQPHNFDDILRVVAESSAVGNNLVAAERWYLKDKELDIIDVDETSKEDAAGLNVKNFIDKYLEMHPEVEGVHYSDIFEHYLYSVKDKPRRALGDWLLDYFYLTIDGTYRSPMTDEEASFKKLGRVRGLNRKIKRLAGFIVQGVPVPDAIRPDNLTLAEWVLHCRRAGLYLEGKLLFERSGLVLDALSEEMQVELEEAYQTCNKMNSKNAK